jgi:pimeloyl-ACP methyl ester carboxylesterase
MVGTMAGASGGAKWLVLSKLDRVVADTIIPRLREPVYLIGSSIGAWRFACYAQDRPLEAIARFEEAYLGQTYSDDPDRDEITAKSREILRYVLGETGVAEILSHPKFRTNVMTVRSRHVTASEQPALLVPGLLAAAALNAVTRRSLGVFFDRVLFYDSRDLPPFFDARGFPLSRVELTEANLEDAIVATGSIPMVLSGVRDIPGAPRGIYRDGGVIDYHLDLPQSAPDRLTLFLHFIDRIVPGWFDKKLSWRKPDPANIDSTILVSPSVEFVSRLPYAKIPDRRDFLNFEPEERVRAWRTVVDMCDELADEFHEVLAKDQLAARL